jgi:DNA-binding NarL/FixJ family response regulator
MIHLHEAIRALNPLIITIRGEEAFDANDNPVAYDISAAQAKLVELQAAEAQAQQTAETHRQSAIAKLTALGLTADEITALTGL